MPRSSRDLSTEPLKEQRKRRLGIDRRAVGHDVFEMSRIELSPGSFPPPGSGTTAGAWVDAWRDVRPRW